MSKSVTTEQSFFFVRWTDKKDGTYVNPAGTQKLAPHLFNTEGKAAGPYRSQIEKGRMEVVEVQLIEVKKGQ